MKRKYLKPIITIYIIRTESGIATGSVPNNTNVPVVEDFEPDATSIIGFGDI